MVAPGKTAEWMENNMKPGFPDYLRKDVRRWNFAIFLSIDWNGQDIDAIREEILDGGIGSGLNYYKAWIQNINLEENLSEWRSRVLLIFGLLTSICTRPY
jgi:hypothetical protein